MTKLNKKLSMSICISVILVSLLSLIINSLFLNKYYLYEKKKIINKLGYELEGIDKSNLISNIDKIEKEYNVTIVYSSISSNSINREKYISENFNYEFYKKGISLKRFWVSQDVLSKIENKSVNKIYNQVKSKYSLLVKFIKKDEYVFAVGSIIEHSQETIKIINKFNIIISGFSVLLISVLIFILSDRIIKPIQKLELLSKDISELNFRTEEIKTNDEIEALSQSINKMSISLEKTHKELKNKNESLKRFIADTSHEMKTPVALIKVYAMGIQDGIDDNTFLDTIIQESDNLNDIINNLLYWAKYEKKEFYINNFDIKEKLLNCLKKYEIIIKEKDIKVNLNLDKGDFYITADENSIEVVLNNLVSNAIKYNTTNEIDIDLLNNNSNITLFIKNNTNIVNKEEIEEIWKPFYVLEKSRNKELSGTGLGLSIVKEILEVHSFKYDTNINEDKIEFSIVFLKN